MRSDPITVALAELRDLRAINAELKKQLAICAAAAKADRAEITALEKLVALLPPGTASGAAMAAMEAFRDDEAAATTEAARRRFRDAAFDLACIPRIWVSRDDLLDLYDDQETTKERDRTK